MPRKPKPTFGGRKEFRLRKLRRILILCEDEKSSRDYFSRFPFNNEIIEIQCVGTGMNTDSLMEEAINKTETARSLKNPFEQVWVVFDKDDFPLKNFNRAFDLAANYNEIIACWSNEAFELWYLLHFDYVDTPLGRTQLNRLVSKRIGQKYTKSSKETYEMTVKMLSTALKNARRLAYENELVNEPRRNPSTAIHKLVERLLELGSIS